MKAGHLNWNWGEVQSNHKFNFLDKPYSNTISEDWEG